MNPLDVALHQRALTQHGLITAADIARLGITPNGVRRRITTRCVAGLNPVRSANTLG
jgi:predicted ArsR family transcriptional regulator